MDGNMQSGYLYGCYYLLLELTTLCAKMAANVLF